MLPRFAAAVILLLASACSPALPVYLGADEPDELVSATLAAVDTWNDVAGYEALRVRMVPDVRVARLDPFSVSVLSAARVKGDPGLFAYTDARVIENRVTVEPGTLAWGPTWAHHVIAHELGHALGLGHDRDLANLMFDNSRIEHPGFEITPKQRGRVRSLLALRLAAWPVH